MKLCTCNHCGGIFEDMNPQVDAKEYPDVPGIKPIVKMPDEEDDDRYVEYWACPKCLTDHHLQDDIKYEALTRIDALILKKKLWEHEPRETRGEDCTEDDSAFIKGWLRETAIPGDGSQQKLEDIQLLFPIEYGEVIDEQSGKCEQYDPPYLRYRDDGGTDGG